MNNNLPSNIAIENVLQSKMRGRVTYQGFVSSQIAVNFSYSKLYNDPSGKGYQRPIDKKDVKILQIIFLKEKRHFTHRFY